MSGTDTYRYGERIPGTNKYRWFAVFRGKRYGPFNKTDAGRKLAELRRRAGKK